MDYSEFKDDSPGDNLVAQITETAKHQAELEREVAELEASLAVKKRELQLLSQKTLPDLMDSAGLDSFKTSAGIEVSIKEDIRASISKERAARACAYLREIGAGALIKNQVIAEFGRGQDDKARDALAKLNADGLNAYQSEAVHPQTLSAWVREKMAEDPNAVLDVELLGISRQRIAKLKQKAV